MAVSTQVFCYFYPANWEDEAMFDEHVFVQMCGEINNDRWYIFTSGVCWAGVVSPGLLVTETISFFAAGDQMADCSRQERRPQNHRTWVRWALFLQQTGACACSGHMGAMKARETLTAISPDKEMNREVEQPGRRSASTSPNRTRWCQHSTTSDTRASSPLTCQVGHQPKTLLGRGTWQMMHLAMKLGLKVTAIFLAMKISRFSPERKESFSFKAPFFMWFFTFAASFKKCKPKIPTCFIMGEEFSQFIQSDLVFKHIFGDEKICQVSKIPQGAIWSYP